MLMDQMHCESMTLFLVRKHAAFKRQPSLSFRFDPSMVS